MQNSLFLRGSSKQTLIDKVPEHLLLSVLTFKFDYFNFDRDTAFIRLVWAGSSIMEIVFVSFGPFSLEIVFHCLSWKWE